MLRHFITSLFLLSIGLGAANASVPDINVKTTEGVVHNVNEIIGKGKWTVVVIWAHNCHICNQEIQEMTFFQDSHAQKDATVLGISIDGYQLRDKASDFIKRHDLNFPNFIIEPDYRELMKFGGGRFVGTPTFYIYNPAGELSAKSVGPVAPDEIEKFINSK